MNNRYPVEGTGLGLRRGDLMESLQQYQGEQIQFMEVAPENWMQVGGKMGKAFRGFTERYPFIAHGLSLSIGSPSPLDKEFIVELKKFISEHNIRHYSEHLSYCSDSGHLYDLMPMPFTEEAVHYVAARIRQVQDMLEQRIAMENISYYAAPGKEMEEIDFLNAVLAEADCDLLLDVNNIYVNSVNHGYDANEYLAKVPVERISYLHVAGHYQEADDFLIDTHGAEIIDPVWQMLDQSYEQLGVIPTLLERDFNIPPLAELLGEISMVQTLQNKWQERQRAVS